MIRLLVLAIIVALPIIFFAQASSEAVMSPSETKEFSSFDIIYGAQDLPKIKYIVDEFMELRKISDTQQAQTKANELDLEINQLVLVDKYCTKSPSSLYLAQSPNPYEKLQEICPALNSIEFSEAISIWKDFI